MIEAPRFSATGEPQASVVLPEALFDGTVNQDVMHRAVVTYLANQRQGTHQTKTRHFVAGGNQKPWRQKGTGRARQGSTRAPHWRHGGIVFGPHPRSYRMGIDLQRDLLRDHGPLGALYPTNTTHRQKEGDSLSFIYLIPTGLNDPSQPGWGGWGGRLALNPNFPRHAYYWASVADSWNGTTHRDNTLRRWAADIQNDFRARLDWCVQPPSAANHPPRPIVDGTAASSIRRVAARPGATLEFDAGRSTDPDGNGLTFEWVTYREAGDYTGDLSLAGTDTPHARVTFPANAPPGTAHLVLRVADSGSPPLAAYRRFLITLPAATQN